MVPLDRLEEDDRKAKRQVFHKLASEWEQGVWFRHKLASKNPLNGPLLCQHTGVIVRADCESQGEFRNVDQGIFAKGPRKRQACI